MKKIYILSVFFILLCGITKAQNTPTLKAEVSKNNIGINERIRIEFIFNENGDDFIAPSFEGFTSMGPSVSIKNSWINGKSSFYKTFTYILSPKQKGTFTIASASIRYKDKVYTSSPIEIKISDAVKTSSIDEISDATQNKSDLMEGESAFIKTELSNTSPYINQATSLTYKLYVRKGLGISGVEIDAPSFPDFWIHDFPIKQYQPEEVHLNGLAFLRFTIKRVLLYPQKSGNINLQPIKAHIVLQIPTQQRDFFGQRIVSEAQKTLSSPAQTLNVKALPEQGKPENFSGAVGNFTLECAVSKTEVKPGEAIQAKIKISGEGNFNLFKFPDMTFPSSFETYEPENQDNTNIQLKGINGDISKVYTVIAYGNEKNTIPKVTFSFFNPKTQKYQTSEYQSFNINIINGTKSEETQLPTEKTQTQNRVSTENSSFNYSLIYPVLCGILGFILILLICRYLYKKIISNASENKTKIARKLAKKYLSEAKKNIGNQDLFYESLERSFHNYLKAKLQMETYQLHKDKIKELLYNKGISEATINSFIEVMKNCEFARYSSQNTSNMQSDYQKAIQVLSQIDKQIK